MHFEGDLHAVLQECGAFADKVLGQFDLLVAVLIHEHQAIALLIEIGEIAEFEIDLLDGFGRAETLVELGAAEDGLELDLGIGAALAGLDVIDLHRDPETVLVIDDEAGADFVAVDFGHGLCVFR